MKIEIVFYIFYWRMNFLITLNVVNCVWVRRNRTAILEMTVYVVLRYQGIVSTDTKWNCLHTPIENFSSSCSLWFGFKLSFSFSRDMTWPLVILSRICIQTNSEMNWVFDYFVDVSVKILLFKSMSLNSIQRRT